MIKWWQHQETYILFDTGFWIGLLTNEDNDFQNFFDEYQNCSFMIPYPSLAEFCNDHLLKNQPGFIKIKNIFKKHHDRIIFYKNNISITELNDSLQKFFSSDISKNRSVKGIPNLVDIIIGKIIEETKYRFVFVTTNSSDFFYYRNKNRTNCIVVLDFKTKQRV